MKEGNGEAVSFFHFSLIRTVGYAEGTLVRQKKQKLSFFLCFVLTYPYLCTRNWFSPTPKLGGVATELRWEWGENPRHYPML